MPVVVPAGHGQEILVVVQPKPTVIGAVAEYMAIVTNLDTGLSVGCGGVMWSPETYPDFFPEGDNPDEVPMIPNGEEGDVGLNILNLDEENDLVVVFDIEAMFGQMDDNMGLRSNGQADGISLNGQPPGTNVTGAITIGPGGTGALSVTVQATTPSRGNSP